MNFGSNWSALDESSEILFGVYGNHATGHAVQDLFLTPDHCTWVSMWLVRLQVILGTEGQVDQIEADCGISLK